MNKFSSIFNKVLTILVVITMTGQSVAQAQPAQQDGKPRIDYSDSTGKVVFIGADANTPIVVRAAKAPGLSRSESALAMVSQYEADFGLRDAESELQLLSENQVGTRNVTRFQQVYQGIPVIAGEIVVNATENAGLLSLSGEIAPDLDINPKPTFTAQQATEIAAEFMQKVHNLTAAEITFTTPELWIYDSRLLQPDGTPPALVWRIEAQANNNLPVNEFILIDATRGHIALNFNQVDTAWAVPSNGSAKKNPTAQIATVTPTPPQPTSTPEPTQPSMPDSTPSQTDIQPTATLPAEKTETDPSEKSSPQPQLGVTYYVDIVAGNNSNSCTAPASPCKNIQETINKAGTGDIIRIASGVYTLSTNPSPNVVINNGKNLTLSGGWNSGFTSQSGVSTIDGGNVNNGYLQTGGIVTIENFIIQNSTSSDSGAIYMVSGALTLKRSTLKNNYASNRGGGIFMAGSGTLTVENSTISGNTALTSGAGMYLAAGTGATATIKNSTISNNAATGGGSSGGGVTQANSASITLTNSIVANNTASNNPDCNGTLSNASYNIIENASGCTITSGSNNSNVDPLLSASLSGTFQVHIPQTGSPAINGGTNTGCPSMDQLGISRPQGVSCDTGAVEVIGNGVKSVYVFTGSSQSAMINTSFSAPLVAVVLDENNAPVSGVNVTFTAPASGASATFSATSTNVTTVITDVNGWATTSALTANVTTGSYNITASAPGYTSVNFQLSNTILVDPNGRYVSTTGSDTTNNCNSPSTPCKTINWAISQATAGNTIYVTTGTYKDSLYNHHVIFINKSINLSGGWNGLFLAQEGYSTIDGENTKKVIYTNGATNIALDHLIIENGYSMSNGGGIDILNNATVNINNLIIRNNNSGSYGGGIYNSSGTLSILNSTIYNNKALNGGGIFVGGGSVNIEYTTIAYNDNGGGLHRSDGLLYVSNSIIANNTLNNCTGGIHYIKYSIISNSTNCSLTAGPGNFLNSDPLITPPLASGHIAILPSSPAINNAEAAYCPSKDQPGKTRPIGAACDIGAWELSNATGTSPAAIYIYPSGNQTIALSENAATNFKAVVLDQNELAVPGINLTFKSPASGPSGVFSNNSNTFTVATNSSGIGSVVSYKANDVPGSYAVQVSINELPGTKDFSINNSPLVKTYNMASSSDTNLLPGNFVCDIFQPDCGGNVDAWYAQRYALQTYYFYYNHHLRKGINNQNMPIVSSTDFGTFYQNAFWSGTQMVYGDNFSLADDVVAHELTHGVTQYESNLFYYYQSGAINESLSDVWGELFDLENGLGNDLPDVKWRMGEELPGGAIRSMSNPPTYSDPDKMTSPYYNTTSSDNGGVHTNSGINNKAAYLMVDGGTFNGKTVTALGANKTLAIYYEAQSNLLSSGADYGDLYNLLYQACLNLVNGPDGITNANCQEVRDATDAVEMNLQPIANFNTDAPLCGPSQTVVPAYQEGFENGLGNWTINNGPTLRWQLDSPYGPFAHSGAHFLYGNDYPQSGISTNATASWSSKIIPAGAYLHFAHAYDFEFYGSNNYDGGVLEYTTNGGASWVDAGSLIDYNGYKGVIYYPYNNPLGGRSAFVGTSHGYISTRVNLASLAGQDVSFRWRMGLDDSVYRWGWWVDDVQIYTCSNGHTVSGSTGINGVVLNYTDSTPKTVTSDASSNYSFTVPPGWSGTVTPTHACYSFSPASRNYSNLSTAQINQNFTPTLLPNKVCTLTIARSGTSPTNAASVDFTVTFTTGVTDVDTNDFTLTSTGVNNPSITSVTPVSASIYTVSVGTGSGNGTIRLDVSDTATISDLSSNALSGLPFTSGEVYTINKMPTSASFGDVPMTHPYWADIEILYANGFTGGCSTSPLLFCPETTMDRAQGAVFMLRGLVGTSYVPPSAPYSPAFGDSWSPGPWAQPWAQGMLQQGLTAGCSTSPLLYCPWEQMPRAQAAVFGMRLLNGSSYLPPAGTGTVFADVNGSEWYAGWAEQAYLNGLLPACGMQGSRPLFCPNSLVSRGLGAYMIVRARNLSMP